MKKHSSTIIDYKNYIAELTLDVDDDIIVGRVINTKDIISFHGQTLHEVKVAFRDIIDSYLIACAEENIEPSKLYSGKFNLRIDPELHFELNKIATKRNLSLNELTVSLLEKQLKKIDPDFRHTTSNFAS